MDADTLEKARLHHMEVHEGPLNRKHAHSIALPSQLDFASSPPRVALSEVGKLSRQGLRPIPELGDAGIEAFALKDCITYDISLKEDRYFNDGWVIFDKMWQVWYPRRDVTLGPVYRPRLPGEKKKRLTHWFARKENFFTYLLQRWAGDTSLPNIIDWHQNLCSWLTNTMKLEVQEGQWTSEREQLRLKQTFPVVFLVISGKKALTEERGVLMVCKSDAASMLKLEGWDNYRTPELDHGEWCVWKTSLKEAMIAIISHDEERAKSNAPLSNFFKEEYGGMIGPWELRHRFELRPISVLAHDKTDC